MEVQIGAMDDKPLEKLIESTSQAGEIVRGDRKPSRTLEVTSDIVREIRKSTDLSQEKFAGLFHISIGTLRSWEQGRRRPDGPAAALLIAIRNNPKHVVAALNSRAQPVQLRKQWSQCTSCGSPLQTHQHLRL